MLIKSIVQRQEGWKRAHKHQEQRRYFFTPGCLTAAAERSVSAAMVTTKRKRPSSVQTSCSLALQELNETVLLKVAFVTNTAFHETKFRIAKTPSTHIFFLAMCFSVFCQECAVLQVSHPLVAGSSWPRSVRCYPGCCSAGDVNLHWTVNRHLPCGSCHSLLWAQLAWERNAMQVAVAPWKVERKSGHRKCILNTHGVKHRSAFNTAEVVVSRFSRWRWIFFFFLIWTGECGFWQLLEDVSLCICKAAVGLGVIFATTEVTTC